MTHSVYLSVAVAVVTLANSDTVQEAGARLRGALAFVFAAFAYSSASVIYHTDKQRLELLKLVPEQFMKIAEHAGPADIPAILAAHIALDILILCVILQVPRRWWSVSKGVA